MKPTKNRIFCLASRRAKMLFATKEEADRFIAFNTEEILRESRKAPVRSYYCALCCGYHVTSNPSTEEGEHMDSRDQELIHRLENPDEGLKAAREELAREQAQAKVEEKSQNSVISQRFGVKLSQIYSLLSVLRIEEARTLMDKMAGNLQEEMIQSPDWHRGAYFVEKLKALRSLSDRYESIIQDPDLVEEVISAKTSKSDTLGKLLRQMVVNRELTEAIERGIDGLQGMDGTDPDKLIEISSAIGEAISQLNGSGITKERKAYNARVSEIIREKGLVVDSVKELRVRKPTKKSRLHTLKVISLLETAVKAEKEGNTLLKENCIKEAIDLLPSIPPGEEKDGILHYLGLSDSEDYEFVNDG